MSKWLFHSKDILCWCNVDASWVTVVRKHQGQKSILQILRNSLERGFTIEIYKESVTGESRSLLSQLLIDPRKGIYRTMDICSRRKTLTPCCFPYRESEKTTYQWGYKQILGHQAGWVRCQMFSGLLQESQFCISGDLRPAGRSVVCLAWGWVGVGGGKSPVL